MVLDIIVTFVLFFFQIVNFVNFQHHNLISIYTLGVNYHLLLPITLPSNILIVELHTVLYCIIMNV